MRLTAVQFLTAVLALLMLSELATVVLGEHGIAHLRRLRQERQQMGEDAVALLRQNDRLREEIGRLKSDPVMLEELARRELGLVRPDEKVYQFGSRPEDAP